MNLPASLVIAIAAVRLTILLSRDEVTQPLRSQLEAAAVGQPYGSPLERLNYLISCHKCTSVWAAGLVMAAWKFGGTAGKTVVQALAVSQIAIMAIEAIDGEDE